MTLETTYEEWLALYTSLDDPPKDAGSIGMLCIRPENAKREEVTAVKLSRVHGVVGDNWATRGSSKTKDGSAHPEMQVTLMNTSVVDLLADSDKDRWKLAGDQLFVDLDLSQSNLPIGARLQVGSAVLEVTAVPHTGCGKFLKRFGKGALKFVSTPEALQQRLRGVNCRVIQDGTVTIDDLVYKIR